MRMLSLLSLGATVALLSTSCAVQIHDDPWCSPVPGGFGAVCDNFLTSNQRILTEAKWEALQMSWITAGKALECTNSDTVGHVKGEIEKLCSMVACDYQTKQAILDGLDRIVGTGKEALR